MRIRLGQPDNALARHLLLPEVGDGTSGASTGGAGATGAQTGTTAAQQAAGAAQPAMGANGPQMSPQGYPLETSPDSMTVDQRAAFYEHQMRRAQDRNKPNAERIRELEAQIKDLAPKAEQFAALEAASKTEAEKAVEQARRDGEKAGREAADADARAKYGTQLIRTRLDGALAGKGLTADQMTALAGDGSRFLGPDGVDTGALDAFLAAIPNAPAQQTGRIDLGGGRQQSVKADGLQAGEDLYAQRHRRKTSA